MNDTSSLEHLARYFRVLKERTFHFDDFEFLKEILDRHPEYARKKLPSGELPLRTLLRCQSPPGVFALLVKHGAEHDIITACAAGNLAAAERLLRGDPHRVHCTDEEGNSPLHWACMQKGYSQNPSAIAAIIGLLLTAGAAIDAQNLHGDTPLRRCILDENEEAIASLLEHGAEADLLAGIVTEDIDLLDRLFRDDPECIHWRDLRDGRSLLHLAVQWECDPAMIEHLLARGARTEIDARLGKHGQTPLLLAIARKNSEAAEVLIRHGADVNARGIGGLVWNRSALGWAVFGDHAGVAEMLLERSAAVDELGPHGRNLLCFAKSEEIAEVLIRFGIDMTAKSEEGRAPLDYAIEEGRPDVAKTLIRHGAEAGFFDYVALGDQEKVADLLGRNPELIRAYNQPHTRQLTATRDLNSIEVPFGSSCGTALHYAVKSGVLRMVAFLLGRGADVDAATRPALWTPLHDATYYTIWRDLRQGESIIRALVAAGADLDARTWGGYSPRDIADYLSFRERSADVFDLLESMRRQRHA